MVEETDVILSKDELLAEMKVATDAGDWKAVSKISAKIAKAVAGEEKAEKDAKVAALTGATVAVKEVLDKAVQKWVDAQMKEAPGIVEAMDGVWYSQDFGEQLTTCRLSKGAVRKAGGTGGGGGKKFNITTNELLAAHGDELMGDSGKTFKEAYDEDTGGNARYKVRMKLLKAHGLS